MALDVSHRAVQGTKTLLQAAMQAGARKEQIAEASIVAQHIGGVENVYPAAQALKELFQPNSKQC